jgi:hypothetical protein
LSVCLSGFHSISTESIQVLIGIVHSESSVYLAIRLVVVINLE